MLRPTKLTWACLALLPACQVLLLIAAYGLDFPFEDEWMLAPLFVKYAHGTLTFSDLFAQQVEYRQFFPNLIIIGLGWFTHWNVKYEMVISFLLGCLISFNIYRLGEKTVGREGVGHLLAYVGANLMIFSPTQYENWLQGQQLIYFIPVACVTTCLLIAYSSLSPAFKFGFCMCLATISSFSAANGLLCWIVVLPALAWPEERSDFKQIRLLVLVWIVGFALSAALYFYHFQMPPLSSTGGLLSKAAYAITYFLALLSSPLMGDHRYLVLPAAVLGLVLVTVYLWMVRLLVRTPRDSDLVHRMLCWVLLGAFSVFTALLITYGRLSLGLGFSLASRYKTFSLYLIVSLIYLLTIVWEKKRRVLPTKWTNKKFLRAAIVSAFVLYFMAALLAFRHIGMYRASLLQAKAGVLLLNTVDYDYLKRTIEARCLKLGSMKDTIAALDMMGFLRPSLVKKDLLLNARGSETRAETNGMFEQLTIQGDWYTASGWAVLPDSGAPADAVLLVGQDVAGDPTVFLIADVSNTGDILTRFRRASPTLSWEGAIPKKDLPPETINLSAWAFDANTARAYRLSGTHTVEQARSDANQHNGSSH